MIESPPVLEIKNLEVKRGGITILNVPSLSIKEGEMLSLIGSNGAGKTTLLEALSCLLKPTQGELYFRGERIQPDGPVFEYRRRLSMVFQEPLLFNTTVFENVASGLKIRGIRKSEIESRVMEQLDRFKIAHLRGRSSKRLSGGEAQRTSLARALVIQPEIFLLDEPFSSLDPPTRESLVEDLEEVLRKTKTTTVFTTHERLEALRLSDRMAVMNEGRILQIGPPEEVMNHPADERIANFVGIETILKGTVIRRDGGTFITSISGQEVEAVGDVHSGERVILCIRPEHVTLSLHLSKEGTSARNVFSGRIEKITSLGLYQKIQLNCGFPLIAYATNHSLEELSLTEKREVRVSFKATAIHVIRRGEGI